MRAGSQTLALLGTPRTFLILQSLAGGTKGQFELRRDTHSPAPSTLRGNLRTLESTGIIVKHRRDPGLSALAYELSEVGRDLLVVAEGLKDWLAVGPAGPHELGDDRAKAAVKGLIDGWVTTVMTTLAAGPLSLTELDKRINTVSYPTIERCLETMRLAEQLDVGRRESSGTPYAITDWMRRGLAPLALCARWEHRNRPDGADPVGRTDIEEAIELVSPLLRMPAGRSGICQLAVRSGDGQSRRRFLGSITTTNGVISFGPVHPQRKPDAWASATADTWFSTLIDADAVGVEISGDRELAEMVFKQLHEALFGNMAGTPGEAV